MPEPREPGSIIEAAKEAAAAGDYSTAEALLREAALVQESRLGPLHPDLANTLNNLGVVCEITGNLVEADRSFRRAYAIATTVLEPDHPFVTTSRKNLCDFCEARGTPIELPASSPALTPTPAPEPQVTASVETHWRITRAFGAATPAAGREHNLPPSRDWRPGPYRNADGGSRCRPPSAQHDRAG